jgi:restriction system protein
MPDQSAIELPLLLELERLGGRARKGKSLYSKIASHFPDLTPEDLQLTRRSTGVSVWENTVDWARNKLRNIKGELNGGERGIWEITDSGKRRLRIELRERGLPESAVESFITSSQTLPQRLGPKWQPKTLTLRGEPRARRQRKKGEVIVQPPYSLAELVRSHEQEARKELRERLMAMEPKQFEIFAGQLLQALGFTDVQITGRSGDGGVDGHGSLKLGVVRVKGAFQFKRWEHNVPRPEIDKFRGAITGYYDQGIFITTSDFTEEAKQASTRAGTVSIVMINGEKIIDIMLENELGVRKEPLGVLWLDEEFFAQFGGTESDEGGISKQGREKWNE